MKFSEVEDRTAVSSEEEGSVDVETDTSPSSESEGSTILTRLFVSLVFFLGEEEDVLEYGSVVSATGSISEPQTAALAREE